MDYLVNPKIKEKNSLTIFSAFIEDNIFERILNKHDGLFESIKIHLGQLKTVKYLIPKKNTKYKNIRNNLKVEAKELKDTN